MNRYFKRIFYGLLICGGCGHSDELEKRVISRLQESDDKLIIKQEEALYSDSMIDTYDFHDKTRQGVHYLKVELVYPMTSPTSDDKFQKNDVNREKKIIYTPMEEKTNTKLNDIGFDGITNHEINKPMTLSGALSENKIEFPVVTQDGTLKMIPIALAKSYFGIMPTKKNNSQYVLALSPKDNITIEVIKIFIYLELSRHEDKEQGITFTIRNWL